MSNHPESFKIVSFSTPSAFDPARVSNAKSVTELEPVTEAPVGSYQVYYNPETEEYFYVTPPLIS